jgi:Fic family protein
MSEYYDRNRSDYYQAIQNVRQQNMDMTGWIEYFVRGLSVQLQEVKAIGKQAIVQDVLTKQYRLSNRQKLAIEYIAKHGGISIQQFEGICPDVTRRTLQRELKELIDKNILSTMGATSNLIYEMKNKDQA